MRITTIQNWYTQRTPTFWGLDKKEDSWDTAEPSLRKTGTKWCLETQEPKRWKCFNKGNWSAMTNAMKVHVRWKVKIDHSIWQKDFINALDKGGEKKA